MKKGFIIAIDGPAGAGKGTVAKLLVEKLHAVTFYTGGMYRAVALLCLNNNIKLDDNQKIAAIVKDSTITLRDIAGTGNYSAVFLNGENVSSQLFSPTVALASSKISQLKEVRDILSSQQRHLAERAKHDGRIVVMDGYDMGTHVVRNAEVKIFLTASVEARAERRMKQYEESGIKRSLVEIKKEIEQRDYLDTTRVINPLPKSPQHNHYAVIDNTHKTQLDVFNMVLHEIQKKGFNI